MIKPLYLGCDMLKIRSDKITADIYTESRVILNTENGRYSIYGVVPGGIAAFGDSFVEAHGDFRKGLLSIFLDIADDSTCFIDFLEQAEKFFFEGCDECLVEWKELMIKENNLDICKPSLRVQQII